ncbi:hypothetical protein Tco_0164441 [Tanacetum coccineum]
MYNRHLLSLWCELASGCNCFCPKLIMKLEAESIVRRHLRIVYSFRLSTNVVLSGVSEDVKSDTANHISLKICALNHREKVFETSWSFILGSRKESKCILNIAINNHQIISYPFMLQPALALNKSLKQISLPLELGTAFDLNELLLLYSFHKTNKVDP